MIEYDKTNPFFKSVVPVKDQEECDKLKQMCIDYEIPYWLDSRAFDYVETDPHFYFTTNDDQEETPDGYFYIDTRYEGDEDDDDVILTIDEFEELVISTYSPQSIEEIIQTLKECLFKIDQILNQRFKTL
jgi:hypothetical protein